VILRVKRRRDHQAPQQIGNCRHGSFKRIQQLP
jgi:hypothetical protein